MNIENQNAVTEDEVVSIDVEEVEQQTSQSEIPVVQEKEETRTNVQEQSDEHEEYSEKVQKRINQLTAQRKQALEEAQAAYQYAEQQKKQNDELNNKLTNLDKGYISEYGTRVDSQSEQAKRLFKEAYDAGDSDKMAEAQDVMAKLAIEKERLRIQKARSEQEVQQPQQPQQQPQKQQTPKVEDLDPKLQTWMKSNTWFGTDMVMTGAAQGLHQQLVGSEGFDPTSDDYYSEIDKRMRDSFPNKFQEKRQNVQAVAPATSNGRAVKSGRKKTVELSPGQVAFAKKMNIPLERYAKEVAKINSRSA
jgi:hypothetical protein|tara:strand:- start:482 stop:1396 length:915 start_codon:yes stop_codon:yes gene_type:complete